MMDGMKIAVPMGSNFLKISHELLDLRSAEERPMERGRKKVTITRATAPIGRLTKCKSASNFCKGNPFNANRRIHPSRKQCLLTIKAPSPTYASRECPTYDDISTILINPKEESTYQSMAQRPKQYRTSHR